jgi:hypothetical protein
LCFPGCSAVGLSTREILRRFPLPVPEGARRLVPYAIGAIAAFWTVERVASFMHFSA